MTHEVVVSRVAVLTRQNSDRIAWCQMNQEKTEEDNSEHNRECLEKPPRDESAAHFRQCAVAAKCGEIPNPLQRLLNARVLSVSASHT